MGLILETASEMTSVHRDGSGKQCHRQNEDGATRAISATQARID